MSAGFTALAGNAGLNPAFDPLLLQRVEDAGLNASAPPQQLWLDGWLLRFCPGKAKRARSVNAVAPGRMPVADKLVRAQAVYDEAGLPMVVRITPFSQPAGLDRELEARGWEAFDRTIVMVAPEINGAGRCQLPAHTRLSAVDATRFADVVGALRGTPAEQRRAHAQRLALSPIAYQGFVLESDGQVLACGQFTREGPWVGLYDVFTVPEVRGQGLATALCGKLLQRAVVQGGRVGYLQVDASNMAAQTVYRRLGFVDGYHYHYRAVDPAAAA